jgi:hypothetical protein
MSDLHVLCKEAKAQDDELPDATANVLTVSSPSKNEKPPESEKGPDAGHGNRFQSKLLVLFCIRAINAEYKFYLGTELAEQGKKFDDLIFKYTKDKNAENTGNNWPYQYLQAKHRLYEKRHDLKITADDLFHVQVKGKAVNTDFNLPKYFRSYCEITRRGDKIDSCIICTNIDFANKRSLWKDGIEVKEVQLSDPILKFEKLSDDKIPRRYKIEIHDEYLFYMFKEETTSKLLANKLWDSRNRKINLNSKSESIRNYHMALVEENVIDLKTNTFHIDFISGCNELSEGAKELRQNILRLSKNVKHLASLIFSFDKNFGITSLKPIEFNYPLPVAVKDKEIEGFLDKLVFAVNTPNEDELDDVLKSEVSNYYKLLSTDLQSAYVMNEMVNWFKR